MTQCQEAPSGLLLLSTAKSMAWHTLGNPMQWQIGSSNGHLLQALILDF